MTTQFIMQVLDSFVFVLVSIQLGAIIKLLMVVGNLTGKVSVIQLQVYEIERRLNATKR